MPRSRCRLEQLVHVAHLSLAEFCERYTEAGRAIGENAHVSPRQAKRWLAGDGGQPRPQGRRVLEHWWKEPIGTLFGPPVEQAAPVLITENLEDLLMTAGRESADHARESAAALAPSAIEGLHAEAGRLSRAYYWQPPRVLLAELIRLRDEVIRQLSRTNKPRQKAELYLIAGEVCGLLASVAFDLGRPDTAEELAHVAYTYGEIIDHPSLTTWARALTMSVLLWGGQYREVVSVATRALEQAPIGTPRVRLHSIRARALAHLGAAAEVVADLNASEAELDRAGNDDLMDGTGGELSFDRSRRALCAGAAYVALRDGERAQVEAQTALDAFAEQPAATRWRAGELAAYVDLATARALFGDLAGAETAVVDVFALAPEHRTEALTQRLGSLGRLVAARPTYRGAIETARIGAAIAEFTAQALPQTSATLALPGAPDLPVV
jgi:hypothetical protein